MNKNARMAISSPKTTEILATEARVLFTGLASARAVAFIAVYFLLKKIKIATSSIDAQSTLNRRMSDHESQQDKFF